MATNPTATLIFGTTSYDLKDNTGTKSTHTHTKDQITDFPTSMTPSNDSNLVHKSGDETITGIKTFTGALVIPYNPSTTPTTNGAIWITT